MKKKDLAKLREKSAADLEKLVLEKKSDSAKSKMMRREIAQILTIAREAKINENTNR